MRACLLLLLPLLLGCRASVPSVATVQPQLYQITDKVGESKAAEVRAVAELIAPYRAKLSAQMSRELAVLGQQLTKGQPESSLGNWMADLMEDAARELYPERDIAFALQNQGGVRVSAINKGPLLVSEIYELMPFDNELVLVELSGKQAKALLAHVVNSGGWPVSRNLRLERKASGLDVRFGGERLDADATYFVAMPDYVANGGSGATMVVGKPQRKSGRLIRDLLIEQAAKSSGPIRVEVSGERLKL